MRAVGEAEEGGSRALEESKLEWLGCLESDGMKFGIDVMMDWLD